MANDTIESARNASNLEIDDDPTLEEDTERALLRSLKIDVSLKETFAKHFRIACLIQLVIVNAIFFAYGVGWLDYSDQAISVFVAATLAEIFGIVLIMTKYLFSKK
ncbi:MAG: hypothetical protein LBO72_04370 [Helicobacteraceae bacterium]|nr:hypothetical protein [Helicobacteraceae bacterium]